MGSGDQTQAAGLERQGFTHRAIWQAPPASFVFEFYIYQKVVKRPERVSLSLGESCLASCWAGPATVHQFVFGLASLFQW